MPEMKMTVRWPDGTVAESYSPSLVLHDHLRAGQTYSVADFTRRAERGFAEASDRVRQRFGFSCGASAASLDQVRESAARFDAAAEVEVLSMLPPLPGQTPEEQR